MDKVELSRYEASGILGTGADYEVRAAVDRETGQQVVLKRPNPQMVKRGLHHGTEVRTDRTLRAYEEVGHRLPMVVDVLGYTERSIHDGYFGESLEQEYRVIVEKRAHGIPLVGDPRARITGVPIGVAQNLFALFPLVLPDSHSAFSIHHQLLDLEEGFFRAGYILLDLRPQNVYYQPAEGGITVIDCGALWGDNDEPPSRGRPPPDIHDFYLEMLKFYATPNPPPHQAHQYREPHGLRPVVRVDQELDEMARGFRDLPGPAGEAAVDIIGKIRDRTYSDIADFRRDLAAYLETANERNLNLPNRSLALQAWSEALDWLRGEHWQRYLFDASAELAGFNI